MRLDALGLVRYGHFTDLRLALPRARAGAPDLHVIYGPNEAGKSTLFTAWLDLLFGIPAQTQYNFLHDNRALRIEAQITSSSGALHLARLKGNKNTLLDAGTGQPLPEAVFGAALGGLDRTTYTTMFSLDDDTLEQGGESILASEGDLGQLLFSASAGLAELSDGLRALHDEGAGWFRMSGRKFQLTEHKARLKVLEAERKEVDLQVSAWRKLKDTVTQAQARYHAARDTRAQTQARLEQVQRDLDAQRDLARLQKLDARCADLPTPQALPDEWRSNLPRWQREEAELAALLPEAQKALARLERALADLPEDPAAAAVLPRLDDLERDFGAIAKERADLPKRRDERDQLARELESRVARLGRPGLTPDTAPLALHLVARLSELLEEDAVLRSSEARAREELARASQALGDAPAEADPDEAALGRLGPLVAELRRADLLRHAAEAAQALQNSVVAHARATASLVPWQGDPDALSGLDLPSRDALRALELELSEARAEMREAQADCARLDAVVTRLRAGVTETAHVSPQEAARIRAERDHAWATHKAALSAATAAPFEAAMHADDHVTAARLEQARGTERLASLREEEAGLHLARARLDSARAATAAQEARLAAVWQGLGIAAEGRPIADLIAWLDKRDAALDAQAQLDAAQAADQAAKTRLSEAGRTLGAALAAMGRDVPEADFATRLAEAEAVLQAAERLRMQARLRRDHGARQQALDEALAARAAWTAEWEALCAESWIGTPAPSTAEMRAILTTLSDLATLTPQARELGHRIRRIEEDLARFHDELHQIAQALDIAPEPDPMTLWPHLRARLRQAQATVAERERLTAEAQAARKRLEEISGRQASLARQTAPLVAHFGALSLSDIARRIEDNAKAQELAEEREGLREDMASHLRSPDLDQEIMRLSALDSDVARIEADTLKATLAVQQKALETAYAELAAAEKALDATGHDGAAARLDAERQTLVLQIEEEAGQFMARQAGVIAVEQALRLYRDRHRSTMMARAADAFAMLTDRRYTGLSTRPEGRGEILIAQLAGGGAKTVDTLSKGTRFQLYLALRAAGYLEFASARPTVPFIADDIMETFDDTRTDAAFRLLARMAQHGQVIYLTHHAHLCEIARSACPEVHLHDMDSL